MKTYIKILCLVCSLLMVLGCFAACKDKEKPESLTDKEAFAEYEKLNSALDKLFYFSGAKHPAASNVTSLFGELKAPEGELKLDKLEASASASIDKLTLQGEDYLQMLGGPVKLNGTVITGNGVINANLGATLSILTVNMDIAADKNGVGVTSPFMFTKPIYVSKDSISNIRLAQANPPLGTSIAEALEKWKEEKLTEENLKHIADLFKGLVPEDAITVSKETPAELKGNFITFDSETECVTLTVTEEVAVKIAANLKEKVAVDTVLKDMAVSFIHCIYDDNALKQEYGVTAEELYNKIIEAITDIDFSDETSDEISNVSADGDENGVVIFKRYFAGGHSVKTDLIVKDDEKEYLSFTAWDAYANTNAREYGMKLSSEGNEYVSVIGGANETAAEMNVAVTLTEEGVIVNADNASAEVKEIGSLKLNASRGETGVNVNGSLDLTEENVKASFDYSKTDKTTVLNAELKADDFNASIDYSDSETEATLKAIFADEGENAFTIDGAKTVNGNKTVYSAEIAVKEDGVDAGTVSVSCECTETVNGANTETDVKLTVFAEDMLELEASAKLVWNTDTDKSPTAPVKDGAYEIKEETDLEGIEDVLTDMFKSLLGGDAEPEDPGNYDETDPAIVGTWECEVNGLTVFYTFEEDGTGVCGTNGEISRDLVFFTDMENSTIEIVIFVNEDGDPNYFSGTYAIEQDTLTIIVNGVVDTFNRVTD